MNKNCGKRAFGPLRPFAHHSPHEDEGEESEDEEEGNNKDEQEEEGGNTEDRGYDEETQRNVMAQDGGEI